MASKPHIAITLTREIAKALAVLALVFLTFGHQTSIAVADDHETLTAAVTASFCGDTPADTTHAPCHACRIGGGGDLPPPPCSAIDAPIATAPVSYFGTLVRVVHVDLPGAARPRGPPALV